MRIASLFLLLAAAPLPISAQDRAAIVTRVSPERSLPPDGIITVSFDRPVLESLERGGEDAARFFVIEPAVRGVVEWRDPVTLRFRPAEPFTPGTRYTIRIPGGIRDSTGRMIVAPFARELMAEGPRLLAVAPRNPSYLGPDERIALLYSAPPDTATVAGVARIELDARCAGPRHHVLRVGGVRGLTQDEPWPIQRELYRTSTWARELRRIVEVHPDTPLPRGCAGALVVRRQSSVGGDSIVVAVTVRDSLRLTRVTCGRLDQSCPAGGIGLWFTTPVSGEAIARHVRIFPNVPFEVNLPSRNDAMWALDARLRPSTEYTVEIAPELRDVYGQPIVGARTRTVRTDAMPDTVVLPGRDLYVPLDVEPRFLVRSGRGDSLTVGVSHIPRALARDILTQSVRPNHRAAQIAALRRVQRIPVAALPDAPAGSEVRIALPSDGRAGLSVARVGVEEIRIQRTNLAVHARLGPRGGAVLVTGMIDGRPRSGAAVTIHDRAGVRLATGRTGADGVARFTLTPPPPAPPAIARRPFRFAGFDGHVLVELGDDRAAAALADSAPMFRRQWQYGETRSLLAASVIVDRGIYRPGETVFMRAIVREGVLGALAVPRAAGALRWRLHQRWAEDSVVARPVVLSAFGTFTDSITLGASLPLDFYSATLEHRVGDDWRALGSAELRVAEYRPPAFLVAMEGDSVVPAGADSLLALVRGTYLFGAPMSGARVRWSIDAEPLPGFGMRIPRHEEFAFGDWIEEGLGDAIPTVADSGVLDAAGERRLGHSLGALPGGQTHRVVVSVEVSDLDRQAISARHGVTVHAARHYAGVRTPIWTAGQPSVAEVVVARPDGERVVGAPVEVIVLRPVRQTWYVRRQERGAADTVGRCALTGAAEPVACTVSPSDGGWHHIVLRTRDADGREAETRVRRWVVARRWIATHDSAHALRVTTAREAYAPSDTIELAFTSPFPRATAWITVDRETVLASEVREVGEGIVVHRLAVQPGWAPNAHLSVMLVAPVPAEPNAAHPAPLVLDGAVEVQIESSGRRLAVDVRSSARADAGDSVRIEVRVADARGRGVRGEVAVWAVDEGILSLTGFATPDPIAGLYQRRERNLRDVSTIAQIPRPPPPLDLFTPATRFGLAQARLSAFAGAEMMPASGYLHARLADSLGQDDPRTTFRPTAFFVGTARTGADGRAVVIARLPDNLTTYRLMAVAVSAGDAYGSGATSLIVTRPLLARPGLPRFVRPGDAFLAGATMHRESPEPTSVRLDVETRGIDLAGDPRRELIVRDGMGTEGRFDFQAVPGDSALIRLRVDDGSNRDAVDSWLPIRATHHPRWHTLTGVVRDTVIVEMALPRGTDLSRSRIVVAATSSPAAIIRRANAWFTVYPWACTEQLVSAGIAAVTLARVEQETGLPSTLDRARLESLVSLIVGRQSEAGSIGYWRRGDWSTPWLSAYAGMFLLDARSAGAMVPEQVLELLDDHLVAHLARPVDEAAHGAWWRVDVRARLGDRVAALDFLQRRDELPMVPLLAIVADTARMAWEDRLRLAEILGREGRSSDRTTAAGLLRSAWSAASIAGNRVDLPDTLSRGAVFPSRIRPAARLFTATAMIEPDHPRLGVLAELLLASGRAERSWAWSTQDWGATVVALARLDAGQRTARAEPIRMMAGGRQLALLESSSDSATIPLAGVVQEGTTDDSVRVRFTLHATSRAPIYFHASIEEIPMDRPVTPDGSGIIVERWYERTTDGAPITEIAAGELVRVRLRVTVPGDRYFVVVDDPLPAGLEVVDPGLRTASGTSAIDAARRFRAGAGGPIEDDDPHSPWGQSLLYGDWSYGWWSPWDHREYRDDRVVFSARMLWAGTYSASYLARATTAGVFVRPPVHAEEMYNRGVHGRSDGGTFTVRSAPR